MKPTVPDVMSAVRMEISEFTMTLPISSVHSSRLPLRRMGRIFVAHILSCSICLTSSGSALSPAISWMFVSEIICSEIRSRPIRPRFRPENRPDMHRQNRAATIRRIRKRRLSGFSSVVNSWATLSTADSIGTPLFVSLVQYSAYFVEAVRPLME